ncbi:MAG: glycosyltransferase [Lachnospiraceae bacterium]|nr:glycosyltransferase [Lachnospiraceae bacterium]
MFKFVFVILHYLTIEDTKECVASIQKYCANNDYHIVIVDNASPNQSGIMFSNTYSQNKRIDVILNSENKGFANGNNVGFLYAKNILNADYIILLNNDTVLFQPEFCSKIVNCYKVADFAVLGPMILTADGKCCSNPINTHRLEEAEVKKRVKLVQRRLFFLKYHLEWLLNIYSKIQMMKKVKKEMRCYIPQENVRLHGSCLIFSRRYIDLFDGLDDRTFMYEEERFLQKRLQDHNLLSIYQPEIMIFHKEGSSTDAFNKNNRKKQYFYLSNDLASLKTLLSDLRQE